MAYCRWSTDDYMCDLYVYSGDNDSIIINVAEKRFIYDKTKLPDIKGNSIEEEIARFSKVSEFVKDEKNCQLVDIELPYAGDTFVYESREEAADKLKELKSVGYNFPEEVIEQVRNYE